uniref:Uncharacterized protein n=1 Tax=Oryza punctata TaxID=4537 RepID=A0A0E0LJR9_ORYPU
MNSSVGFRFGSLDLTANKAGILRPTPTRAPSPIALPQLPFSVDNLAAIATNLVTSKVPINYPREGAPRPQLPHELEPCWIESLDEFVRLSDTETESFGSTPTSHYSSRDVFVVLHPETEAKEQEHEEEERRIKQQQEDLNQRMEELRQRGRATRDAIL